MRDKDKAHSMCLSCEGRTGQLDGMTERDNGIMAKRNKCMGTCWPYSRLGTDMAKGNRCVRIGWGDMVNTATGMG